MSGLSEIKSWREEDSHFVLCDAPECTVFGAVALPTGADEPLPWHYHAHDTLCMALTPVAGVNEIFGVQEQKAVTVEKGEVLLYHQRGLPKYVHRFRVTCDNPVSFIAVEVPATPLPSAARRATLKDAILLKPDAVFASAARIAVPPRGSLELARNQGFTPFRSAVVSLSQNGLKGIAIKNAAKCEVVRKVLHDFLVEVFVVTEETAGSEAKDGDACVVVNATDGLWVGAVVDIWVQKEE